MNFQRVDVILVPFDHLALVHGCGLNRHQLIEAIQREDKTTGVL
jgi:hypothetical protein